MVAKTQLFLFSLIETCPVLLLALEILRQPVVVSHFRAWCRYIFFFLHLFILNLTHLTI